MADEYDSLRSRAGVFVLPDAGLDDGVSLLDDVRSMPRDGGSWAESPCTRVMYDDSHPRNTPGGRRYPGPYGGGRATDKVGPDFREMESFRTGGPSAYDDLYARGDRRLGHPGFRGQITSARGGRPAIENVAWDNRPPHYSDESGNDYAHLVPADRGPPLFFKGPSSLPRVEHFAPALVGAVAPSQMWAFAAGVMAAVVFFAVVVLIARALGAQKTTGGGAETVAAVRDLLATLKGVGADA